LHLLLNAPAIAPLAFLFKLASYLGICH
jgi:hypothetical protein